MRSTGSLTFRALVGLLLAACAPAAHNVPSSFTPPDARAPDARAPDARAIVKVIAQQAKPLERFRGSGRLRLTVRDKGRSARVVWIGSQPESLRVEALTPWGQPIMTFLLVEPNRFRFVNYQTRQELRGSATPGNLQQILSVPIESADLFSIFSVRPPLLAHDEAVIRRRRDGRLSLSLYKSWRRLVERLILEEDGRTIQNVEVFDGWGRLMYSVRLENTRDVDGIPVPQRLQVVCDGRPVLDLSVDRFAQIPEIPPGAFILDAESATVTDLDL